VKYYLLNSRFYKIEPFFLNSLKQYLYIKNIIYEILLDPI
jgi:hypothetical protein